MEEQEEKKTGLVCINIYGGNHQIMPNATHAVQKFNIQYINCRPEEGGLSEEFLQKMVNMSDCGITMYSENAETEENGTEETRTHTEETHTEETRQHTEEAQTRMEALKELGVYYPDDNLLQAIVFRIELCRDALSLANLTVNDMMRNTILDEAIAVKKRFITAILIFASFPKGRSVNNVRQLIKKQITAAHLKK